MIYSCCCLRDAGTDTEAATSALALVVVVLLSPCFESLAAAFLVCLAFGAVLE